MAQVVAQLGAVACLARETTDLWRARSGEHRGERGRLSGRTRDAFGMRPALRPTIYLPSGLTPEEIEREMVARKV